MTRLGAGELRHEGYVAATCVLEDLSTSDPDLLAMPRPVVLIAKKLGTRYSVDRPPFGPTVSGMVDWASGTIVVSAGDGHRRARFTIAHELGHWYLGTFMDEEQISRRGVRAERSLDIEPEADGFAAGLLLDHPRLLGILKSYLLVVRPHSPEEWARQEIDHRVVTGVVKTGDVSYRVVLQSMAEAGLVVGVTPWNDQPGMAYGFYRQEWNRLAGSRHSGRAYSR